MRLFSYLSAILLFCSGIILLSFDITWFPDFYDVRYMGIASLVGSGLILILPQFFFVEKNHPDAKKKNQGVSIFQFCIAFALMNNALGDLGFYELYRFGFEYDKLVHFITPLVLILCLYKFFEQRFDFPRRSAIILTFSLVLTGALGWELYEYWADYFFETHIYGVFGTDIVRDTILDLICGTLGAIIGILIISKHPKFTKNV